MDMKKYNQLQQEIGKLQREAEKVRKVAIKGVIQHIQSLMQEHGIALDDLNEGARRGRKPKAEGSKATGSAKTGTRAKVKPKYRSPEDKNLTWTGRGRTPKWVKEWTDAGHDVSDLLI